MGENSTCLWAPHPALTLRRTDRRTDGQTAPSTGQRQQESQAPNLLHTRPASVLHARCFPADLRPLPRRTGPPGGREQGPSATGQAPSPGPAAARGLQLRARGSPGGDGARWWWATPPAAGSLTQFRAQPLPRAFPHPRLLPPPLGGFASASGEDAGLARGEWAGDG